MTIDDLATFSYSLKIAVYITTIIFSDYVYIGVGLFFAYGAGSATGAGGGGAGRTGAGAGSSYRLKKSWRIKIER